MKIMIVGIGGVGGYIAGMVGQKYKNLTLIARGKRGEALREHGVVLHSDFHGEKKPSIRMGEYGLHKDGTPFLKSFLKALEKE